MSLFYGATLYGSMKNECSLDPKSLWYWPVINMSFHLFMYSLLLVSTYSVYIQKCVFCNIIYFRSKQYGKK